MERIEFKNDGYVVEHNFLDDVTVKTLSRYFENKINRREWNLDSEDPVSGYSYYADPLVEIILKDSTEVVEKIIGEELYPTYSFCRVYRPGETLTPHIDRPSCEVSLTINIANVGENSPIYMKYPGKEANKYFLNPGDAVIYQGCVVEHWRETLKESQLTVQFMLHYVRKNGRYSDFKYDKRQTLGLPNSTEK